MPWGTMAIFFFLLCLSSSEKDVLVTWSYLKLLIDIIWIDLKKEEKKESPCIPLIHGIYLQHI